MMKLKFYTVLFGLFIIPHLQAQMVTTIVDSVGVNLRDDLILDHSGNLYCSDYGGSKVYKLTPSGVLSTFVDGLNTPNGLAFDSQQNLFICDNIGDRIYKVDLLGNFLDTFMVDKPSGIIKKQDSDTLIFTEYGTSHRLSKLSPNGVVVPFHSGVPLNGPVGLAYDDLGQLYVANFNDRKVFKVFEDSLVYLTTVPGPSSGVLGFLSFGGGYLWATSWSANKIYGLSTSSDSSFLYCGSTAGGIDGDLSMATFARPNGILSNLAGDTIYISEYTTGKLRRISPGFAGVTDKARMPFSIYPNPSLGTFNIESEFISKVKKIELINVLGTVEKEWLSVPYAHLFQVDKGGVYILKLVLIDGREVSQKLIVN